MSGDKPSTEDCRDTDQDEASQDGTSQANSATPIPTAPTSLLTTLLSPFTKTQPLNQPSTQLPNPIIHEPKSQSQSQPQSQTPLPEQKQEPEPYYTPNQTPLFKSLQRKRLTGTRTRQLLRAASRAYNDPPPPPALGMCCGSSCDPCVNELWREEIGVWREVWGDRGVEDDREEHGTDKGKGGEDSDSRGSGGVGGTGNG